MGEIEKTIGQMLLNHIPLVILVILCLLTGFFKITKKEIDPLGWVIGWFGKKFTKDVRNDVANLKEETNARFEEIKTDRAAKIDELKGDYNDKIIALKTDLDNFEDRTNKNIDEMKAGTSMNCEILKNRLNKMEESNDMQTIRQIKAHVLDFANSCLNHRKHTKRDFDNIIKENEEYEKLIKKYGLKNDVYTEDYNYILKIYHRCQDEDSFLRDNES